MLVKLIPELDCNLTWSESEIFFDSLDKRRVNELACTLIPIFYFSSHRDNIYISKEPEKLFFV